MKYTPGEDILTVQVRFQDKELVKAMGFRWDPKTESWWRWQAKELAAVEIVYLQELEREYSHEREEAWYNNASWEDFS